MGRFANPEGAHQALLAGAPGGAQMAVVGVLLHLRQAVEMGMFVGVAAPMAQVADVSSDGQQEDESGRGARKRLALGRGQQQVERPVPL